MPLHYHDGLPYMDMSVPTPDDMDYYPTVFFTSDSPWDPSILDGEYIPGTNLPDAASSHRAAADPCVTDFGEFIPDPYATHAYHFDLVVSTFSTVVTTLFAFAAARFSAFPQYFKPNLPDVNVLHPSLAPESCMGTCQMYLQSPGTYDPVLPGYYSLSILQAFQVPLSCCQCLSPSKMGLHGHHLL